MNWLNDWISNIDRITLKIQDWALRIDRSEKKTELLLGLFFLAVGVCLVILGRRFLAAFMLITGTLCMLRATVQLIITSRRRIWKKVKK